MNKVKVVSSVAIVFLFLKYMSTFAQLAIILLVVLLLWKYSNTGRSRVYIGGLFYFYFIAFLQLSSNFLITSWLTVILVFVDQEFWVTVIWIWSLIALTFLQIWENRR